MKTVSIQITVKDGWSINRIWGYDVNDAGEVIKKHPFWSARLDDGKTTLFDRVDAMHRVGEQQGWRWIGESIDFHYHPDTGEESAALVHFTRE